MKEQLQIENKIRYGTKEEEFTIHLAAANVFLTTNNGVFESKENLVNGVSMFKEDYPMLSMESFKTAVRQLVSVKENMFTQGQCSAKPLSLLSTDPVLEILLSMVRDNHELYILSVNYFRPTDTVSETNEG